MKRIYLHMTIALMALSMGACCCWDNWCVDGEGRMYTEERYVGQFSKIELTNDADVFIAMGDDQEVVAEAQDEILDELDIFVRRDILYIEYDNCVGRHDGVNIFITLPYLTGLKVSGSGDIINDGYPITCEELDLKISGSGDIRIDDLVAEKLDCDISGSGDIVIAGPEITEYNDINISGSGSVRALNLPTENANINIYGSGDCRVNVIKDLHVDIYGSGNVYYVGDPDVYENLKGSGNVYRYD
jgi:hypothetical protein